jgi:leader peptidase (prepilin peptidase)/N-methyltransferase
MYYIYILILFIVGISFGSFINAFVWRFHQNQLSKKKNKKYSIVNGRSMCPNCEHQLAALDLVPVFSWIFLAGKCRYCHKKISISYPAIEIFTALIFIISFIYWPIPFNVQGITLLVIWLIILTGLITLGLYDIKYMLLPNRIIIFLFCLVILQIVVSLIFFDKNYHYIINSIVGFVVGGGIFYILFQISKGDWIGGGDIKLGALLGLYLGNGNLAILMIFIASLIGTIFAIPLIIRGKLGPRSHIPYGPYLILATIILTLIGVHLIRLLNNHGIYV